MEIKSKIKNKTGVNLPSMTNPPVTCPSPVRAGFALDSGLFPHTLAAVFARANRFCSA